MLHARNYNLPGPSQQGSALPETILRSVEAGGYGELYYCAGHEDQGFTYNLLPGVRRICRLDLSYLH